MNLRTDRIAIAAVADEREREPVIGRRSFIAKYIGQDRHL